MSRIIASSLRRVLSTAAVVMAAGAADAAIIIQPTFDSSFTSQPNAAALEATVNNALAVYSTNFSTNLTVPITFALSASVNGGESSYSTNTWTYSQYLNALTANAATATDATVLANLPAGATTDPVIGGTSIAVTQALGVALGLLTQAPASYGTVTFNLATYSANPAGFLGVIQHEVNEVLGTASSLPNNVGGVLTGGGTANLPTTITPADLFRYNSDGTRSFTLNTANSATSQAFFRLGPAGPNIQQFNNLANGGDYGDWAALGAVSAFPNPSVQDWTGSSTVFTSMSAGSPELTMLDAVGFNAIPEPGTVMSLSSVALGMLAMRRRKQAVRG